MSDCSDKQGRCPIVIDILLTIVLAITIVSAATEPSKPGISFDDLQNGATAPAQVTIII